jgi:hypothetical protein
MEDYEVFKGIPHVRPVRLGSVRGVQRATDLMNRMYARLPGNYFVCNARTREVIASLRIQPAESSLGASVNGAEPPFDIFCGTPDKEAKWYETIDGLANARERMEQIARVRPGKYFVFSRRDHSILAQVETFPEAPFSAESHSAA